MRRTTPLRNLAAGAPLAVTAAAAGIVWLLDGLAATTAVVGLLACVLLLGPLYQHLGAGGRRRLR